MDRREGEKEVEEGVSLFGVVCTKKHEESEYVEALSIFYWAGQLMSVLE